MNGERTGIQIRSERVKTRPAEKANGRYYFYVRIFLEDIGQGTEYVTMADIDYVIYRLHPSFKQPLQRSNRRESNFEIRIWTYGYFYIGATLVTKKDSIQIRGKVQFDVTDEEKALNPEEFQF